MARSRPLLTTLARYGSTTGVPLLAEYEKLPTEFTLIVNVAPLASVMITWEVAEVPFSPLQSVGSCAEGNTVPAKVKRGPSPLAWQLMQAAPGCIRADSSFPPVQCAMLVHTTGV